jgi:hypothetical protein
MGLTSLGNGPRMLACCHSSLSSATLSASACWARDGRRAARAA